MHVSVCFSGIESTWTSTEVVQEIVSTQHQKILLLTENCQFVELITKSRGGSSFCQQFQETFGWPHGRYRQLIKLCFICPSSTSTSKIIETCSSTGQYGIRSSCTHVPSEVVPKLIQFLKKIANLWGEIFAQILPFRAKSQSFANVASARNFCANLRPCGAQVFAKFVNFEILQFARNFSAFSAQFWRKFY